jgi:hypothetical protein
LRIKPYLLKKLKHPEHISFQYVLLGFFLQFLIFQFSEGLFAESGDFAERQIQSVLIRNGFENVAVSQDSSEIIITYENRVYRFEVRAIYEVLSLVAKQIGTRTNCILIPQNRGVPLVTVTVDSNAFRFILDGKNREGCSIPGFEVSFNVEPHWLKLRNRKKENSSAMKLDATIHPQFKAQFGNVNDAIESQINLAPSVSTTAWKGMSLSAQWIFPIQNELDYEGDYGRPGLLTLNQTIRFPSSTFVSGTVGYFSEHRYGMDLEVKKFLKNGRWAASANVGYTGFAAYLKHTWLYSDIADWTYFLSGEYRFSTLDFVIKATYGKFLYRDKGLRLDMVRQFDEVDIGFFIITTEAGRNGGIAFTIPIFPSKRLSPKRVRVSPALYFPWSYWYRGQPVYGIQYTTCSGIDGFIKKLNPDFVTNQLSRIPINH